VAIISTDIREWDIYKITSPSGRVYIGKSQNLKSRLSSYRTLTGKVNTQRVLYNSLLKYGFKSHKIEVIDSFSSDSDYASGKEMFWIRSYMSNRVKYPKFNGMNLTDGGDGITGYKFANRTSSFKGKKHTEETKKILREYALNQDWSSRKGVKMSDEQKLKLSLAKKGKPSSFKGKKHTEEYKKRASESKKGKPNYKLRGRSIWSDEDKIRIGISKLGNQYMKGKRFSEESKEKSRKSALKRSIGVLKYSKEFVLLKEYRSIHEAAQDLSVSRLTVSRYAKNFGVKSIGGFYLKYK